MSLNTKTLFQILRLMIVAGGKQEKERKETTRAGLYNQGLGRSDVAEKDSTCTARRFRGGSGGEGPLRRNLPEKGNLQAKSITGPTTRVTAADLPSMNRSASDHRPSFVHIYSLHYCTS